jgi:hypothetical protein
MFSSDIVLVDAAAANKTFVSVVTPGGKSTLYKRVDSASTLSEPRTFSLDHQVSTVKGFPVARHLSQMTHVKKNATTGLYEPCTVNITTTIPLSGVFSVADAYDLVALQKSFLSSANFTKMLNNES